MFNHIFGIISHNASMFLVLMLLALCFWHFLAHCQHDLGLKAGKHQYFHTELMEMMINLGENIWELVPVFLPRVPGLRNLSHPSRTSTQTHTGVCVCVCVCVCVYIPDAPRHWTSPAFQSELDKAFSRGPALNQVLLPVAETLLCVKHY